MIVRNNFSSVNNIDDDDQNVQCKHHVKFYASSVLANEAFKGFDSNHLFGITNLEFFLRHHLFGILSKVLTNYFFGIHNIFWRIIEKFF